MPHLSGWSLLASVIELMVSAIAIAAMAFTSRHLAGSPRSAWRWLVAAGTGWALGHAWRLTESIYSQGPTPVGASVSAVLLLLPLCAIVGLARNPALRDTSTKTRTSDWTRLALDAASISLAVLAAVWQLPISVRWRRDLDHLTP